MSFRSPTSKERANDAAFVRWISWQSEEEGAIVKALAAEGCKTAPTCGKCLPCRAIKVRDSKLEDFQEPRRTGT